MQHFESMADAIAAQLLPDDTSQLLLNPTSGDLQTAAAGDPLVEAGAYAVALPEVLEAQSSWDVYRYVKARTLLQHMRAVRRAAPGHVTETGTPPCVPPVFLIFPPPNDAKQGGRVAAQASGHV